MSIVGRRYAGSALFCNEISDFSVRRETTHLEILEDCPYLTYMYTDRCSFLMNVFNKFTIHNLSKHLLNWHCKTQMLPNAI